MKRFVQGTWLVSAALIALTSLTYAAGNGTKAEAEALVKKTVSAIKADGADKTYAAITSKDAAFIDRDLYPVVYDMGGKCISHGANPKLVGKDLLDVQDADGKFFIKERVEKAKTGKTFWQEYKYTNPLSKKIEPKEAYCEPMDKIIVCAGAYKAQ